MFPSLVYTELMKYKRTIIPWIIGIGGFLASCTGLMFVATGSSKVSWEVFAGRGLNFINLLSLLLAAVFTGFVFITEYSEGMVGVIFTYPVSRFKLYLVKNFIILLMVLALFLTFYFSTILFGYTYFGALPSIGFLLKLLKLTIMMVGANFVLVPVTALISIVIKGIGTYLLAGMSYFITYISFINSDYSLFIPVCIPDKLAANYIVAEYITKSDFLWIIIISIVTFIAAFLTGGFYYSKSYYK